MTSAGVGASTGSWPASTLDDLAADAAAALRFLRQQIPSAAVGLFGHSEGGWVVLRAATGRDDVPFVVTTVERLLASEGGRVLTTVYWDDLGPQIWEFEKRKQDHDPIPDISALHCPYLALFGGADQLVPVVQSVGLLTAVACEPGRHAGYDLTMGVFPAPITGSACPTAPPSRPDFWLLCPAGFMNTATRRQPGRSTCIPARSGRAPSEVAAALEGPGVGRPLNERRPDLYLAGYEEGEGTSTLGGQPGWIQDPDYPACPACGKIMAYVGAVAGTDVDGGGVGVFYLFLHTSCGLAAVVSQFS